MLKSKRLDAEGLRRQEVALMKFYGWLIEWIESKRSQLKQKEKISHWLALFHRIMDLRNQVIIEYLSMHRYGFEFFVDESRMRSPVLKMIEIYDILKKDLGGLLIEEDSKHYDLPMIEKLVTNPLSKLSELNVCLGQLLGHVFRKLYEYVL